MKETFKISCKKLGKGQIPFYSTVEGEEAFIYNGYRFFIRRDWDDQWIVSDVRYGAKISESPFYDDAIKLAKEKIERHFIAYLEKLKKMPAPRWKVPKPDSV